MFVVRNEDAERLFEIIMGLRSRKKRNGSGYSYFIDWYEHGKRKRITLNNCPSREFAQLAYNEFELRKARGQLGIPTNPKLSLSKCLSSHLALKRGNVTPKRFKLLESNIRQILEYFGDSREARTLTPVDINEFKLYLKTEKNSPCTINRKIGFIKAAVARSAKNGLIPSDPISGVEMVSDTSPPKWRYLSEDDIRKLLSVLKNGAKTVIAPRNRKEYEITVEPPRGLYEIVVFLLNTGVRLGEAFALRWEDIDLNVNKIRVTTTKRAIKGRNAVIRYIPINKVVLKLFKGMKDRDDSIFKYDWNTNRKFTRACKLAGIANCRIHDLRHTFASMLVMAGVPLITVKELLGHSKIDTTLRYAHLAPSATVKAVESLNIDLRAGT